MFLIVLSAFVLIGALTAAVPTWAADRRAAAAWRRGGMLRPQRPGLI